MSENTHIEIYQPKNGKPSVDVKITKETVWLNRHQLTYLFQKDIKTIGRHINNVIKEGELSKNSVVAKFATTATDGKIYQVEHYNLDMIISVGYRVKSKTATQFRIWATNTLRDHLVKGYTLNEKRLNQKNQEILQLKTGIQILNRMIEEKDETDAKELLNIFAKGLELLDDYDHKVLDKKGKTEQTSIFPLYDEYIELITKMYSEFESDIFALPKDDSFKSSVNQIAQTFDGKDLYPTLQEKAANLLYFIVKNHSFVDGNKRIGAGCFLYFLDKNNALFQHGKAIISNEALASLTLFIASSKNDEADIAKQFIISILNRNLNE